MSDTPVAFLFLRIFHACGIAIAKSNIAAMTPTVSISIVCMVILNYRWMV